MKAISKYGGSAATFFVAATLGAMNINTARAGEYCRTDVTAHMTSCPYDNMEQCKMTQQGMGGDCFRDPNLPSKSANANGLGGVNRNAFAYAPDGSRAAHRGRYGTAASPD
jgi:hypothetical protein